MFACGPLYVGIPATIVTTTTNTRTQSAPAPHPYGDYAKQHDVPASASPPLTDLDTSLARAQDSITLPDRLVSPHSPASAGLRLQTDFNGPLCTVSPATATSTTTAAAAPHSPSKVEDTPTRRATPPQPQPPHHTAPPPPPPVAGPHRTPSVKATLSASTTRAGSLSPGSAFSSPALGPMVDITPLPSPLVSSDSPGPWNRITASRPGSRGSSRGSGLAITTMSMEMGDEQRQRKTYQGLGAKAVDNQEGSKHGRNRSLSEYTPETSHTPRPRHATVSVSVAPPTPAPGVAPAASTFTEPQMKRESYLAVERGLAGVTSVVVDGVPTPPPSHRGIESSDSDSSLSNTYSLQDRGENRIAKKPWYEYYDAVMVKDGKRKRWRALHELGQGTFSKVMLATSQEHIPKDNSVNKIDEEDESNLPLTPTSTPSSRIPSGIDPTTLVAVKIIEHGPAGGASEDRIESSLKRELDILKSIHHPSVVHLEAFSVERTRALLVLRYCAGGDLFELAASEEGRREVLGVGMIRRIFAELVGAVGYLHAEGIVHRDVKLENILLTLPPKSLPHLPSPETHPTPLTTLTDLGLSKRIDPAHPLLTTRCGSEDYAAPELLMGLPYDGRATDAWACGVVLFALLQGRLPFDVVPGALGGRRGRVAHRIARCEWTWPDPPMGPQWDQPRRLVDDLLKRRERRAALADIARADWVAGGVAVEGGLRCAGE
ncbi:MAG: hypothetical protein M1839_005249 [Geoglossum umbratile]|nr:MAG: hypothetical protein M1839_005249 [Geoglossum umbratile]